MDLRPLALLVAAVMATTACAAEATDDEEDDELVSDDDPEGAESGLKRTPAQLAAELRTRWRIPQDVLTAGAQARFAYDGFDRCAGGLLGPANTLKAGIANRFAGSLVRKADGDPRIEGYNCRRVRGRRSMSIHGTGRALDIFVPMVGSDANNAKGDPIASYLVTNARELGVQYVIWDRTQWKVGTGEAEYRGDVSHRDHIHVELTREADGR